MGEQDAAAFLGFILGLKPREQQETPVVQWGVGAGAGHVETPFPSSVERHELRSSLHPPTAAINGKRPLML